MKLRKLTNDCAYLVNKIAYFNYDYESGWIGRVTPKAIVEHYGVTKEEMKLAQAELKSKIKKEIQFAKDSGVTETKIVAVYIDSPRWRLGFVLEAAVQFYNREDYKDFDKTILAEAI